MVMVPRFCEYAKNNWIIDFKWMNYMYVDYILLNLLNRKSQGSSRNLSERLSYDWDSPSPIKMLNIQPRGIFGGLQGRLNIASKVENVSTWVV